LVKLAVGSVATDLLSVLKTIKGFGQDQKQQFSTNADLTADKAKHGAGYVSTDHAHKTSMKDILKSND